MTNKPCCHLDMFSIKQITFCVNYSSISLKKTCQTSLRRGWNSVPICDIVWLIDYDYHMMNWTSNSHGRSDFSSRLLVRFSWGIDVLKSWYSHSQQFTYINISLKQMEEEENWERTIKLLRKTVLLSKVYFLSSYGAMSETMCIYL